MKPILRPNYTKTGANPLATPVPQKPSQNTAAGCPDRASGEELTPTRESTYWLGQPSGGYKGPSLKGHT